VTAAFDHETAYVGGAFFWRFMPKTSLLFQYRHTSFDYPSSSDQSSSENLFAVGLTWDATAQTTGIVRVGYQRKEFDAPGLDPYSGLAWEATIRWRPRTYSTVEFTTAQHTTESTGFGDFTLSRVAFANWTHNWTERIQSAVRAGLRNDDYRGGGVDRDDDTMTAGAGLQYQFRRWLRFEGRYDFVRRSSNIPTEEYNRNIFMFTVGATL
jgi:polysaccharide biosynthesis protein VpsM